MRPLPHLLVPALLLSGSLGAEERMKDGEARDLARKALESETAATQRSALKRLQGHVFKSSKAPEREYVLFAMGLLQDRLGQGRDAADTFRKLERQWPESPYLEEAQLVLAEEALSLKRYPDAAARLRRVLASEQPVETKRRAQELLLWSLVEQELPTEGKDILATLHPLPAGEKPQERGLVAMFEVAVALEDRKQAEALHKDYARTFKTGAHLPRVELGWGRFLGAQGDSRESALVLRKLIQEHPKAPEANEARLALATLLSDGKLPARISRAFPTPERLVAELEGLTAKGHPARRALVLKLKLAVQASSWKEALGHARHYRLTFGQGPESEVVNELWGEAFRAWAQQLFEKGQHEVLLEGLRPEAVQVLLPEQRLVLLRRLAKGGITKPIPTLLGWSPGAELPALKGAVLQDLIPEAHPDLVLALLPGRQETGPQRALRARALVAKQDWAAARAALGAAPAGSERLAGVLALLNRPLDAKEGVGGRLREAEGQLARAPEKGADRLPLVIRVADLRTQVGDWRGALALYPASPGKDHLGWVALMRATAQLRLGQKEAARATLKAAEEAEAFRPERQTLERQTQG